MPGQFAKTDLLKNAGYVYNFERMMYINRRDKKAFSYEFIDDNLEPVIKSKIQEPNREQDWHIYTSLPMSDGAKKELIRVLQ